MAIIRVFFPYKFNNDFYHLANMVKQLTSKGQKVIAYWLSIKGTKMWELYRLSPHLVLVSKNCLFLSSLPFKL